MAYGKVELVGERLRRRVDFVRFNHLHLADGQACWG